MTCARALERMLVAEPEALGRDAAAARSADPELAGHLGGCARCRAVADALAAELVALDAGLADAAGAAAAAGAAPAGRSRSRRIALRGRGRGRVWVPLAAAAVLATVFLVRGGGVRPDPAGTAETGVVAERAARPAVAVTLPADRGAAVMATTNPRITVVWLYERSER